MHSLRTYSLALLSICGLLLSGCVGSGPHTQRGAVTGGVLGGIAGAIIGNNSGNHDTGSGALIGAAVGAMAGGAVGNAVDHERGTIYVNPEQAQSNYYTELLPTPPPLVREVVVASPGRGFIWIPGCWTYTGRDYSWQRGYWTRPPHKAQHKYVAPHWERSGFGHIYIRGYWH